MEQRQYQEDIWHLLDKLRQQGQQRALIHLATGLGKTTVAAVDVQRYLKANRTSRIMFVSHMNDISSQAQHTFQRIGEFKTARYKTGQHPDPSTQVLFATFQSLYKSLDTIEADTFDYIIWDEAHHIEAETFRAVREHFSPQFELGLTATPERADGRDIFEYFGEPVYSKGLGEGIAEGWLSPVDYHIVFDETVKQGIQNGFDLQTLQQIRQLFAIRVRNEIIAKEVLQRRHTIGLDNAKTIVFCSNTEAAEDMAQILDGKAYHSRMPAERRTQLLKDFRNGALQVICTVDMFNEGIDIPDARLVVFLRSTSSRTIFEQQLGRGLRRHPGKNQVTILDFVANVERIDFVRELGHTISKHRGSGEAYSGKNRGGHGTASTNQPAFYANLSTFEFEDQTIELLRRYQEIKTREHIPVSTAEVVAAFKELRSAPKVAEKFNVSSTVIYKHLRRAGINASELRSIPVTVEQIAEAYYRLGSSNAAAAELGISSTSAQQYLKRYGYKLIPRYLERSDEEIIAAFERFNSVRAAARSLGIDRKIMKRRLDALNVQTVRAPENPRISRDALAKAYTQSEGNIVRLVGCFNSRWTDVYRALDEHGYLENPRRPISTAVAAAAYFKTGSSTKAGALIGIGSRRILYLTQSARYMPKYGRRRTNTHLLRVA